LAYNTNFQTYLLVSTFPNLLAN